MVEVMEVGVANGMGSKTKKGALCRNRKMKETGKEKKENRQLGIVFPRLSLSGANTKGAASWGGKRWHTN